MPTHQGPVPQWPSVKGTYQSVRQELNNYGTAEEKIAVLAYFDTLIHQDIASLSTTGVLGPAPV